MLSVLLNRPAQEQEVPPRNASVVIFFLLPANIIIIIIVKSDFLPTDDFKQHTHQLFFNPQFYFHNKINYSALQFSPRCIKLQFFCH